MLNFFFTVTFLLGVGQASLLGGFSRHSRRLTVGQVQTAGEIEERGSQFVGEPPSSLTKAGLHSSDCGRGEAS